MPKLKINPVTGKLDMIDGLEDQMRDVQEATLYSNDEPMVEAHGGIRVGETFDKVPICEMLTKILYPPKPPLVTMTVNTRSTYHQGFEIVAPTLTITVQRKSYDIHEITLSGGEEKKTYFAADLKNGKITHECEPIAQSTTYKVTVSDVNNDTYVDNNGKTQPVTPDVSASLNVNFAYPLIVAGLPGESSDDDIKKAINEMAKDAANRIILPVNLSGSVNLPKAEGYNTHYRVFASPRKLESAKYEGQGYSGFVEVGDIYPCTIDGFSNVPYHIYRTNIADDGQKDVLTFELILKK